MDIIIGKGDSALYLDGICLYQFTVISPTEVSLIVHVTNDPINGNVKRVGVGDRHAHGNTVTRGPHLRITHVHVAFLDIGNQVGDLRHEYRFREALDVVPVHVISLFFVQIIELFQQQGAILVIFVFLVGLGINVRIHVGHGIDMGRHVVLGRFQPAVLDLLAQRVAKSVTAQHVVAFSRHEFQQGGGVEDAQVVIDQDVGHRVYGDLFERLWILESLAEQLQDLAIKLLTTPLAHVGGRLLNGVVAVTIRGIAVAVAIIDHCLKKVEQRLVCGAFLLLDDFLELVDDAGHIVLRDAALGDAVAHQRIDGQLAVSCLQRLFQVGKRICTDVLREVEVNFLFVA